MKSEDPVPAILLIVTGVIVLGVWQFSRSIGADFQVTFEALLRSAGILAGGFVLWWSTRPGPLLLLSGCAIFLWPTWWPVLESIATGDEKPDIWFPQEQLAVWWNTTWFKWSIELGIVAAFIYLLLQRWRDPYA